MKLDVSGHPLHTRSLNVSTSLREDGRQRLDAAVIDLRKCGVVPVAGMLQCSGLIHHMTLEGVVDPASRILESLEGQQPTKAFEPSAITKGECCFDPVFRLRELAGEKLEAGIAGRLREVFGGNRGCSHLLSLAQLAMPAVASALDWDEVQPRERVERRPGERIFHRAVEIDGFELEAGKMQIVVQLSDVHFRAAPEIAPPMRHFGAQTEVRIIGEVDLRSGMALDRLDAWERRRDEAEIETAEWRDRSAELQSMLGQRVMGGMGRRLLGLYESESEDRPLLDGLMSFAPGYIQCIASLSEEWPRIAKAKPDLMGMHGQADACHMWRAGGALHRVSEEEKAGS